MCGICGIINNDGSIAINKALKSMNDAIVHRGPDDEGFFIDHNAGLAMRRLSIIDLNTGHQPMFSYDERYVIVYNGELYNFRELQINHLREYRFKTKSDTEVILNLYHKYGVDCLKYLNGMFAIAIYDKEKKELFIARDRLGIKPLFYYKDERMFLFSSEAKSFFGIKNMDLSLDLTVLNDYLTFGFIPQPFSIFKKVKKLSPGHYLKTNGVDL
jgi:asparagine synthase (glutamine-hydrolysing)